jgi:vacuolar-type H+-ATPase catalytic subunit A/Vma1
MEKYTYGAMSSKFELESENKLTAYATMVLHYDRSAHLLTIYTPESSKEDNWASFDGRISERLDEVFGGEEAFDKYVDNNVEAIRACYKSIKRLV